MTISQIKRAIRCCLTDELRKSQYKKNINKLAGHCYVASEAFYHLMGGKSNGWKPMFIRHEKEPHWFIQREDVIVDITAGQFSTKVDYSKGCGKGFLTQQPSKRAQILIQKVKHFIGRPDFY